MPQNAESKGHGLIGLGKFRIRVFYKPPFCKRLGEENNEHKDYRHRCKDAERHILSA